MVCGGRAAGQGGGRGGAGVGPPRLSSRMHTAPGASPPVQVCSQAVPGTGRSPSGAGARWAPWRPAPASGAWASASARDGWQTAGAGGGGGAMQAWRGGGGQTAGAGKARPHRPPRDRGCLAVTGVHVCMPGSRARADTHQKASSREVPPCGPQGKCPSAAAPACSVCRPPSK